MGLQVLRVYEGAIRKVLEFVRDGRAEEGLWFHCTGGTPCLHNTAGRDRTGVVAGLLLSLAGASADTIRLDYMLSRIGYEVVREQLVGALASSLKGAMPAETGTAAIGLRTMSNLSISCWDAFVKAVDDEYGGFEGYVTGTLGFSAEDVARIKANLVLPN
ncbi:hypothetical protein VTK26DRAFT_2809 [Humicola hyalothermophila]